LSLGYGSFDIFFTQRVAEEKEEDTLTFLLGPIGLCAYLGAFASVTFITFLCFFSKVNGCPWIVAAVVIIIIVSSLVYNSKQSVQLKSELERSCKIEDGHIDALKREITEKLWLSALFSWIINTLVVKSTVKIQLVSNIISTIVAGSTCIGLAIHLILKDMRSDDDFSILNCMPQNFTKQKYEKIEILYGNYNGLNLGPAKPIVRLCEKNEEPTDVLQQIIIPLLAACVVLKLSAGISFSSLLNYGKLLKTKTCFKSCFPKQKRKIQQSIHYLDVIESPLQFKDVLLDWLHDNPDHINKQNRLTGQTILHVLEPKIMAEILEGRQDEEPYDEFLKLYLKGGQHDLLDQSSRTAHSNWIDYHLPQLPRPESKLNETSVNLKMIIGFYMGLQPAGRDQNGDTKLKLIARKLKDLTEQDQETILGCLSMNDIFELMTEIVVNSDEQGEEETIGLCKMIMERRKPSFIYKFFEYNSLRDSEPKFFSTTPLHFAAKLGYEELLKILLKAFPYENIRNFYGRTILHEVCISGNAKSLELVFELKPKINAKSHYGVTPLHAAARYGDVGCVKEL